MSTITKKRPTQILPHDPDDFELIDDLNEEEEDSDEEEAPSAAAPAPAKPRPVKQTPKKKIASPKPTNESDGPELAVPKRKRGAPKGRRSNMENPGESRPFGHKGMVAIFYGEDGDKGHRWAIFGRNGRKIAISPHVFSTFQPTVDSVRTVTGTDHDVYKDENGYQTIDL